MGEPNAAASNRKTLRWGSKGSLSVEVTGSKKGFWFSHEGGEGSDLLGLIRHVKACRFPDAVEWAARHTGIVPDNDEWEPRTTRPSGPSQAETEARAAEAAEAEADEADRIAFASRIAAHCTPLAGTLGEIYLKQVRGIPVPAAGWPAAIQFHPAYRALVAIATGPDGTVRAVQRVHLGEDAAKVSDEERAARRLPAVKTTNGVTVGAVVRLPGDPAGPLLIAEGPETGLSVYTSTGHETWISLGSVTKVTPPTGRKIIVVSDDNPAVHDARYGQAAKSLRKALQTWRKAGVDLVVATPWHVRRKDRSDFADVILQLGVDAVRKRLEEALSPARSTVRRLSVNQARKVVADAVGTFLDRVDALSERKAEWDKQAQEAMDGTAATSSQQAPPARTFDEKADQWEAVLNTPIKDAAPTCFVHGVRCDVGTGKSHAARERVASTLASMRKRGDDRAMVLAVPMHALSNEQATLFQNLPSVKEAGLRVAVWRGRAAEDPNNAGEPMCGRLDDVNDAQAVGLSAQTSCCKRKLKQPDGTKVTVMCPLFHSCSYQAQTDVEADLWIMASDMLWHEKPTAIGEVAAVIVDESAWRKGLLGAEGRHLTLSIDAIGEDVDSDRLRDLRRQLLDVARSMPDGPVRRAALFGESEELDENGNPKPFTGHVTRLIADSAAEGLTLEYARKVETLWPGQSKEERRAGLIQAEGNKTIGRFAMVWNALRVMLSSGAPAASGWLSIGTEPTKDGPVRMLHLKGRREIAKGWKAPTLLLDALLPVELVRPFWPDIELVADVKAEMPHQHIRQVVDRAFAQSMLEPMTEEAAANNPEEAQRRSNRLHDVRAILIREARRYAPGRVLTVLQKDVKEALSDLGSLPPNLDLAHHNNVAGRDEWRDVAALIVVGRTLPGPGSIARITDALTGTATAKLDGDWYPTTDAVREMVDGTTIQAEFCRHPDPLAESIRWQTCEGELLQIIGRARGVNRTSADPVDILVLTDVPLPIPLSGVLNAVELTPGPADHMIAAGGVILENPTDAALAFPFLWATRNAAKLAFKRAKLGSFPYKESYIGKRPQLRRIDYKSAGQGKQAAIAGFDPALCPDPEAFLCKKLGPLAWCRIEGVEPPEPEPSRKSRHKAKGEDVGVSGTSPEPDRASDDVPRSEAPFREAEPLVCDVPWLHADAPAFQAADGAVILPACPYCGGRHRHGGFGHRIAHCANHRGRGYVLRSSPGLQGGEWAQGP